MLMGIYQITNLKLNKRYIGCSSSIGSRFGNHIRSLEDNNHSNKAFQLDYNNGNKDLRFEILELVSDINDLPVIEQYYINWIKPEYNSKSSKLKITDSYLKSLVKRQTKDILENIKHGRT